MSVIHPGYAIQQAKVAAQAGNHEKAMAIAVRKTAVSMDELATLNLDVFRRVVARFTTQMMPEGVLNNEDQQDILCKIARRPDLIARLYDPECTAARLLFFARLKRIYTNDLVRDDSKRLEFPPEVMQAIKDAYDLETDYNTINHKDFDSNKSLAYSVFKSAAGNLHSTDHFSLADHNLWYPTRTGYPPYWATGTPFSPAERATLAEILIGMPCYDNVFFGYAFEKDKEKCRANPKHVSEKYERYSYHAEGNRRVGEPFRYPLGMEYRQCALLMIRDPSRRGGPGEITNDDLEAMARKHGLQAVLKAQLEKEAETTKERLKRLEESATVIAPVAVVQVIAASARVEPAVGQVATTPEAVISVESVDTPTPVTVSTAGVVEPFPIVMGFHGLRRRNSGANALALSASPFSDDALATQATVEAQAVVPAKKKHAPNKCIIL